jgi:hypothetical protein
MKKILLTLLSVLFCAITFAQSVPQGINYQAVARDASGAVLMNQALTIQFSVISDITTSAVSWQETHTVSTNDYGLYTAIIGGGTATNVGSSVTFDVIDWGASNHLLKVEVDYGSGLVDMGTTAFMSVPYSIYSANPGAQGLQGVPGVDGDDGQDGQDGNDGQNGYDGQDGIDGIDGIDGQNGDDGNDGIDGVDGADGQGGITNAGTGISVTGAGTSVSPYVVSTDGATSTISFWSCGQIKPYPTAPTPYLSPLVAGIPDGMPILPHGEGTYYNIFGSAIGPVVSNTPIGFGEYMAYNGSIIGAAVNFTARNGDFKFFVCNYSTGAFFQFGFASVGSELGSISYNTSIPFPTSGTTAGAGQVTINPNPYPSILFNPGDYIGIFIDGPPVSSLTFVPYNTLECGLEGTLYLNIP